MKHSQQNFKQNQSDKNQKNISSCEQTFFFILFLFFEEKKERWLLLNELNHIEI